MGYLTISIFDRLMSLHPNMPISVVQLTGGVSLWIASKFEDYESPTCREILWILSERYSHEQLLTAECTALRELNFELCIVSPLHFLDHMCLNQNISKGT